jgi:xanthine phosphoribosyltransferase
MADPASAKKRFLVTWDQFHNDCRAVAKKLLETRKDWKGILVVTTGGLIPAGIISWELEIKLIDVIGISSYAGYDDPNQKKLNLLKEFDPKIVGDGDGWIVIDDLVDSGNTFRMVRGKLPKAHLACIYAKPEGEPVTDTFVGRVSQDHWIYFPWYLDTQPVDPIVYAHKKG